MIKSRFFAFLRYFRNSITQVCLRPEVKHSTINTGFLPYNTLHKCISSEPFSSHCFMSLNFLKSTDILSLLQTKYFILHYILKETLLCTCWTIILILRRKLLSKHCNGVIVHVFRFLLIQFNIFYFWNCVPTGRSRGTQRTPPSGPKFLYFHTAFRKNWSNSMLPPACPPPKVGAPSEILDPPLDYQMPKIIECISTD